MCLSRFTKKLSSAITNTFQSGIRGPSLSQASCATEFNVRTVALIILKAESPTLPLAFKSRTTAFIILRRAPAVRRRAVFILSGADDERRRARSILECAGNVLKGAPDFRPN